MAKLHVVTRQRGCDGDDDDGGYNPLIASLVGKSVNRGGCSSVLPTAPPQVESRVSFPKHSNAQPSTARLDLGSGRVRGLTTTI